MQRADLDRAAELFDLASDGRDEEAWAKRFQNHIGFVMRKHSTNLRAGGGAAEQRLELLRARLELHDVVSERLEARAAAADPELGALLRRLRNINAPLVAEIVSSSGPGRPRPEPPMQAPSPTTSAPATPSAPPRRIRTGLSPQPSPRPVGRAAAPEAGGGDALQTQAPAAAIQAALKRGATSSYGQLHEARRQKEVAPPPAKAAERGASAGLGARPEKELALRQLRVIVSMVYASKAQHDQRCAEMREPLETMEQHLYSFLGKRYGHKSLVEEWARAIFRAIEREASRECDIAVFGKILQNKLAENFAPVQDTICKTVTKLLRESLQRRHPQRPVSDIDAAYRAWTRSGVPLAECEKVAHWMYDEAHSERLLQRLREVPRQAQPQEGTEPAETHLRYREFVQTLVLFQMQLTEDFLADLVQLFGEVDADDDGILSGPQLQELHRRLADPAGLGPGAVAALDEASAAAEAAIRGRQSATFSECVELFAGMIGARSTVGEGVVDESSAAEEGASGEEAAEAAEQEEVALEDR